MIQCNCTGSDCTNEWLRPRRNVPHILIDAARQAASKSGGKGAGGKCGPPKKSGACGPKKNSKGANKDAKTDAEKCGGTPSATPPSSPTTGGAGKAPLGNLGGVGRESSCKAKVPKSGKGTSTAEAFRKICLFGILPAIALLNILIFSTRTHEEREEFKMWPHLYKRDKRFPWRDGIKSLFHNSYANPLPDTGYEDE
ncbi:PREDICTED: cytochrome c oxidase subunit 6A1, mitochondrial isoform X1 [Rhagoletis zephyria]|uniref:cytochrome c oxidase subunit 6A1, mitochondrial isoform X1 n=1 Tax=Rhagoletis zephyria TaxID=28612 RepID=UPI000811A80E|nr:PREDICTED: cytochrome c oxidase subunit 6A1, mitochondrial isoform X1 [Rhagoletis zephyria]